MAALSIQVLRCRTALDRFLTPAETHRLRELSLVELSDRMSCTQQTQIIKKQCADLKQQKESTACVNEEVSRLTAELGVLKSRCQTVEHKLSSWDKKHRKYRNERDTLSTEKAKIEEELVGTKSQLEHRERLAEEIQGSIASFFQSDFTPLVRRFLKSGEFNWAFTGVLNTAISIGVERGLRMDRTDEEFRGLSQEVAGFIPDDKEKFDRVIAAFLDTTFPFLDKVSQHSKSSLQDIARLEFDRVTPSSQPSSGTASLRANTHVRHSTSSHGTFGHTSTPEHLRKRRSPLKKEVLQLLRPALATHRRVFIMREREKCLFPSLLLQSQLAEVAQPNHQWHQFHHWGQISRSHPIHTEVASHPSLYIHAMI
ncbi:hypothetical protein Tco_0753780 [Tanacetum coccineum]